MALSRSESLSVREGRSGARRGDGIHIDSRVDELVAAGMSRDETAAAAHRQFGNRLHVRESSRVSPRRYCTKAAPIGTLFRARSLSRRLSKGRSLRFGSRTFLADIDLATII